MSSPTESPSTEPLATGSSDHQEPAWAWWRRHLLWCWLPGILLLLLDQGTKYWAQTELQQIRTIPVIDGFWSWTYVRNTGIAFGMAKGMNWLLTGVAVLLVIGGIWWARQLDWRRREVNGVAALLVSGAIGNLIDRVRLGYVVDFVDITIPVINYPWPVFNVADSCICLAVGWILFRQFVAPPAETP